MNHRKGVPMGQKLTGKREGENFEKRNAEILS